jgi:hypothetical protein
MITRALSMAGSLYDAIGPGLILVAALPFLVIALFLVVRAGLRRPTTSK